MKGNRKQKFRIEKCFLEKPHSNANRQQKSRLQNSKFSLVKDTLTPDALYCSTLL